MEKPPLIVIAGPTASGKSALALDLARTLGGVLINADASQLYRDLRILSARPTAAEEAEAPHRLYGILPGEEACSAARWAAMARDEIASAHAAGRIPILVGGTGLYLRTLIEGIAPVPPIPEEIRAEVRALPAAGLRAALLREDPAMAERLHPHDPQRQARALEVIRATGRSLLWWQQAQGDGLSPQVALDARLLLPDRAWLAERIDRRFDSMMAEGALEEARALLALGLPHDRPVMKALGVRPLIAHLHGRLPLAAAVEEAKRQTRAYAKRQLTWFAGGGQSRGWIATATRLQLP
ncbi:tRNA (adenosine(37)-N6)-dimethylallyltransferase MiaA [Thermaurantiacus sp.]